MKTIPVAASKKYDVLIGSGFLSQINQYISFVSQPCKAVLVSDSNVASLYAETIIGSLSDGGYDVLSYVFPAGEEQKNGSTYFALLDFLAYNQLTRSDLLIALGGGVVGDLTGFAAATYLRGISYIQIPTSLLAMVDSSIGGKTGINLPSGKNLAGAFYQPELVLCDLDTLATVPESVFLDGCAEVIKYAILYDPSLFSHLMESGRAFDREFVICRCVEWKNTVVAQDEFDTASRQKLNLGHTIAHGIEAASHYRISHGHAVAMGLAAICKAAVKMGHFSDQVCESVISMLENFSFSTSIPYPLGALLPHIFRDKKRSDSTINLIIPHAIGDCRIHKASMVELETILQAGL